MSRRNVQEPIFLDLNAKPNSGDAVVTASELATSNSKMLVAFARVKEITDRMRFGPIPNHRNDKELLRHFADRIDEAIKEFVKGETNA